MPTTPLTNRWNSATSSRRSSCKKDRHNNGRNYNPDKLPADGKAGN
jgi:hypothetical protein